MACRGGGDADRAGDARSADRGHRAPVPRRRGDDAGAAGDGDRCVGEATGELARFRPLALDRSALYHLAAGQSELSNCKRCHAPLGPGRTTDIEQSLDFTTRATALTTLRGTATGLIGNHSGCIDLSPGHPDCDIDMITDATVKVGSQPSTAFVAALKTWIGSGAMDN